MERGTKTHFNISYWRHWRGLGWLHHSGAETSFLLSAERVIGPRKDFTKGRPQNHGGLYEPTRNSVFKIMGMTQQNFIRIQPPIELMHHNPGVYRSNPAHLPLVGTLTPSHGTQRARTTTFPPFAESFDDDDDAEIVNFALELCRPPLL